MEFSKWILIIVLFWGIIMVTYSYVLATLDKNVNEGVTIGIVGSIISTIIGYLIYQAKLKMSRDKYCVNKDGIPFSYLQQNEIQENEEEEVQNEEENHTY